MKPVVSISRFLVGGLFIFSGLVKAIDPLGLAYKMEEFFEAWSASGFMPGLMHSLSQHSLGFSIAMITAEVVLGVALILGWQKKTTSWLLFLLTLFFTFLTAYVLFSGKIRECGCFGNCIPLTPQQTFSKDIVLTILGLIILLNLKHIQPLFKNTINLILILVSLAAVLWMQFSALKNLPQKDCLPFKVGNDILEMRKMPTNAVPDKYDYKFIYKKDGKEETFGTTNLPDSTWTYVDRKQILVEKGKNNIPPINDFNLLNASNEDVTDSIMGLPAYYLLFIKDLPTNAHKWLDDYKRFQAANKLPVYLVTASPTELQKFATENGIVDAQLLSCDGVAIKTAARSNPALFKMEKAVVKEKWGWGNFSNLPK